jgi:hypothetical protein
VPKFKANPNAYLMIVEVTVRAVCGHRRHYHNVVDYHRESNGQTPAGADLLHRQRRRRFAASCPRVLTHRHRNPVNGGHDYVAALGRMVVMTY